MGAPWISIDPGGGGSGLYAQPVGIYSDIIESDIGYHIVMVLDRAERPLSSDARLTLQHKAVAAWLTDKLANSAIENLTN